MTSKDTSLAEPSEPSQTRANEDVDISLVIPLFNESETVAILAKRIFEALDGERFEIVFVDDGSTDDSWRCIENLANNHSTIIRGYHHRRNFGKAEALATGFAHAGGSTIVTLDADLQDDPTEIPSLIEKLNTGFDLVSGWKKERKDPISKTLPSSIFNWAARLATNLKLHDFNCGLKAYRQEVVQNLKLYGELHRFIPILAHADGYRVTELPVTHHPREYGVSKYGWRRFIKGFLDLSTVILLTRYFKRPVHFFGGIGLAAGGFGSIILSYLTIMKSFFDQPISGRPLFFLGILSVLFAGQLLSIGVIGEFLLRLGTRSPKNRATRSICIDKSTTS